MKKRFLSILLAVTMLVSLVPMTVFATGTTYAITNGTPESANAKNNGYIAIEKTSAAEGDKVEITDLAKWKAQVGNGYIAKLEEESEPVPTGDDSNVFIWIILLAVSAVGLCICFVFGKKK